MYCPQCGQQQASDAIRFCSRCGFLLDGVSAVVASGGIVPTRYVQPVSQKPSPRGKGVRQGAMLMLSGMLVVPIVALLSYNLLYNGSEIIIPLSAMFCFIGGLLRILYALLMEDSTPEIANDELAGYGQQASQFNPAARHTALPPPSANIANWRPPASTAEIYQPPSITENTTRLLDHEEPKTR
jgi:hypothetical protein